MSIDRESSEPFQSEDHEAVIRELRIRVGLLQSELEQLKREHATLKSGINHDVAALARRYLEPAKHVSSSVRTVDGVIFGGWDRQEQEHESSAPAPARDSRSA